MKKETFTLYLTALISGILITMFISALVTYMALSNTALFFKVWPLNWFYAALVAFPTILLVRPVATKITTKIANLIY
ncbi:DUF2798 domain-containing protein [Alphaproteobacteria bacterium]|nr:DUF2798 domain-containing protein [Alphaproteobacteria bacterium]